MLLDLRRVLAGTLTLPVDPALERSAAVAAIFRERAGETELLLIERAEREGDPWSGHMALPGGRRNPGEDLIETAIRETREEIGIELQPSHLVGILPAEDATGRGSKHELSIHPFVFILDDFPERAFEPNHEVKDVLWTPVRPLLAGDRATTKRVTHEGQRWELPGWEVSGRVVWGLTYRMLSSLFARVGD
jgi:8-oxo-dGTP pyrophosphatase MutT (NUDIX family)